MECHTLEAMKNRFACKNYLNKEIEDEKLGLILEAGRLSPASFGLEHWHFHVCRSQDILWTCPAQESMKTAPVTVVITCNNHTFFDPEGSFFKERMSRFPLSFEESKQDYMHHYNHLDSKELDQWSRAQSYIAVTNMTTVASELGIQSCIIEGYNSKKLLEALDLNPNENIIGIVCAFGYQNENNRKKIRLPFDEVVTFH